MKTTERFNKAVIKLYTAFHEGTLDAFYCESCAVGNIVGHGFWQGYVGEGLENKSFTFDSKCMYMYPPDADYTPEELRHIEYEFLRAWNGEAIDYDTGNNKELQFEGLSNVIEYLAKLDGIDNPFDFSKLFNDDNVVSSKELELIK